MAKVGGLHGKPSCPYPRILACLQWRAHIAHGGFGDQISKSACLEEDINDNIQMQLENAMKWKPETHDILICHHESTKVHFLTIYG